MDLVTICCVTGTLSCWRGSQGEKPVRLAQVYIPNWLDYALGREHLDRFKIETYRLHPEIFCPPKKEDPNA